MKAATGLVTLPLAMLVVSAVSLRGEEKAPAASTPTEPPAAVAERSSAFRFGGQLSLRRLVSWPGSGTLAQPGAEHATYGDSSVTGRLLARLTLGAGWSVELHDEVGFVRGDTWGVERGWHSVETGLLDRAALPGAPPSDARRLLDLTRWVHEGDREVAYNRIDRLSFSLQRAWGTVRVGRQAISWGNGLIFNPTDVFAPFSPIDVERDYKLGEDAVVGDVPLGQAGGIQAAYVARRDPVSGRTGWDTSTAAARARWGTGPIELNLLASRHYRDGIVGAGATATVGDVVMRVDAVLTSPAGAGRSSVSFVANADTSWSWSGRPWYAALELYRNGMGGSDIAAEAAKPEVRERLARGDVFTLGTTYLAATLRMEAHPLCSVAVTAIANARDRSGVVIPRLVWEPAESVRVTLGGNVSVGDSGTEYGGFTVERGLRHELPDRVFAWLAYYF